MRNRSPRFSLDQIARDMGSFDYGARSGSGASRAAITEQMASHLAALVEQCDDAIISTTPDGVILTWNEGAARVYGYTAEDIVGQSASVLFPSENLYQMGDLLEQLRQGKTISQHEGERLRKDGRNVRVSCSLSPIRDSSGRLTGISIISRDITDSARVTREMEAMNAELRRLSGELMRMQDHERRRIARELHDGPVQELAAIVINLSAVKESTGVQADSESRRLVEHSIGLAENCARGLRTISYLLHPPMLDELGLGNALSAFVDGFMKRTGIAVRLELPRELERLPGEMELALFRIVQESLANVYRHSGSPVVEIRLCTEGGEIRLDIEDQGSGIPDAGSDSGQLGVGIPGMQQRVRQLGGEFRLDSQPGRTAVRVRLPAER